MDSPGHKANIVGRGYRAIGVARVGDTWCQLFGG